MNPSCGPELEPTEVGNAGDEDVSVVESLVGLKRLDDCYQNDEISGRTDRNEMYPSLPNQAIVPKVLQHCTLSFGEVLNRIFL